MENIHYYNTNIKWEEGRLGRLESEGFEDIKVATPPEFPNGIPGIWSPEHLYTASASTCLMTTFLAIAENSSLEFSAFSCEAVGKLEKIEGKFLMSEIELKPVVTIGSDNYKEKALRIIEKAEKACLISNSMKTKIVLTATVLIKE